MAYKINGTTVVDNSRNVCACCVTSCCVTASTRLDVPSGDTASRPASPATGSLYFDTDEGALVAYDGTDWSSVGGAEVVAKFSSGDDGTVAATSYLLGKTNCLCMTCMGINSGDIPCYFSHRTPLCRAFCTPSSSRGGHISFGADGSFVITTGVFKNIPAQNVTGSDDKCYRHMSVTHGVFQNNRCCYIVADANAISGYVACCYQPNSNANWCLNYNLCCQNVNICSSHSFYYFYSFFSSAGNSENGGYLTGGCVPGNVDYIVPYTSLGSSLCPAYKMVNFPCLLTKSVICNYVLTNNQSCGGRWIAGGLNNVMCCVNNGSQGLPWGTTITCQNCSADLFLQDVTDLGYYTKSGDCYTTTAAGTCGCFRHLNTRNRCTTTCYNGNFKQHAWENKCSGDIFVITKSGYSLPCITWSTACSAYHCLQPKILKINRSTGCMTLYRPFGCGCGGGSSLLNPECMDCHSVFGANLTRCSINSIFYTYPNSNCVRVITAHNTYQCHGTYRYFEHGFTLWNVSNAACIYAICSGQFRTCVAGIACCHAIPMHINLLHWDEASCKGFWSMAFSTLNEHCNWSNRGIGFAITQTDFTNCTLCILDGVRSCSTGLNWGQWGKGSLANCCNCIECRVCDMGDGIWPMPNGNIGLKWNFEFPQGQCNCCAGAMVRLEDWTSPTFDICTIIPSTKRCCACYALSPGINCCTYLDTLCLMPKYCCICTAQYCLSDICGTTFLYCLFPHSTTPAANHYCLCETTYGEAVCWVDRPSSTCCICGCINFSGSSVI